MVGWREGFWLFVFSVLDFGLDFLSFGARVWRIVLYLEVDYVESHYRLLLLVLSRVEVFVEGKWIIS